MCTPAREHATRSPKNQKIMKMCTPARKNAIHSPKSQQNLETSLEKTILENTDLNQNVIKNKSINFNQNIEYSKKNYENNKNVLLGINSFRNFVELFYHHKELILHTKLYNNVKIISFKEGEITINSDSLNDSHFNRNVAKLISKWTGRIWQIHSSSSNIGKTLYEEDLINQQIRIEEMKNHPEIKNILESFKGVKIHSITDISETRDEMNLINDTKKEKEN